MGLVPRASRESNRLRSYSNNTVSKKVFDSKIGVMYFDQVSNQGIFKSEDFGYCRYVKVGKE